MHNINLKYDVSSSKNNPTLAILSESSTPNPSSIKKKSGFGSTVTWFNAALMAKDDINLSMPDANERGHLGPFT